MTRYIPNFQTQRNPADPNRTANCVAYSAAMAFDGATLGGLRVSGMTVRALTSEPTPIPGSPGLNFEQIVEVCRKLYVPFVQGRATEGSRLVAMVRDGRYVMIAGYYSKLPAQFRRISFSGKHVMIVAASSASGASVLLGDPLHDRWAWVPTSAVVAFWNSLGRGYLATRMTPNLE